MKILVTGGAGYIGGTVCRLLLAEGHAVTVLRQPLPQQAVGGGRGAEFVEGDLADRALLEKTLRLGRFDGVMHFAALIEAGESMQRAGDLLPQQYGGDADAAGGDAGDRT